MSSSNTGQPKHQVESMADRRQQKELAAARQSGQVAPAVDSATGQMINPHNPEFITKRPWYLGQQDGGGSGGIGGGAGAVEESLQHQADQRPDRDRVELSLSTAEQLLEEQRQAQRQQAALGTFHKGQWVEALKKNKLPYRICQIIKIHSSSGNNNNKQEFDLKYEDGTVEKRVKPFKKGSSSKPRIRMTVTGNRTVAVNADTHGKETYSSKRDAYHGYDRDKHNAVLAQKYEQKVAIRRKLREEQQQEKQKQEEKEKQQQQQEKEEMKDNESAPFAAEAAAAKAEPASDSDFDDSDVEGGGNNDDDDDFDSDEDEFVQHDQDAKVLTTRLARQGGVGGAQMKVTARNLRIREDTAKYLRNLDPNSAYYDPKSRSMRDNPHPEIQPDETDFAGDNFARVSGDAVALAQQQLFAWDATEQGVQQVLHPQANPSQAEILKKQFQSKSQDLVLQKKRAVLEKYGGQEYLDGADGLAAAAASVSNYNNNNDNDGDKKPAAVDLAEDRKLRFGVQTEQEHYAPDGRVLTAAAAGQQQKRKALESKYEEDIFINGHTTVWGSYFHKGAFTWGYDDDHSLMRQSYCTGANGRIANDEANEMQYGTGKAGSAALAQARGMLKPAPSGSSSGQSAASSSILNRSKLYGEADPNAELDAKKVQEALRQQTHNDDDDDDVNSKKKKRKYHSMEADNVEMTQEQMEAYRLQKEQKNDPMANIGGEELLDYKK